MKHCDCLDDYIIEYEEIVNKRKVVQMAKIKKVKEPTALSIDVRVYPRFSRLGLGVEFQKNKTTVITIVCIEIVIKVKKVKR